MTKIPLVLLPGTLCDSELWVYQTAHLSDIAEIQIGDITKSCTIENMAKDVLDQSPPSFALAGLSLGGIVAIEIARQAPKRVIKLALMNSTANPPYSHQQEQWSQLIDEVEKGDFLEVVEKKFLPNLLYKKHSEKKSILLKAKKMAERVGSQSYLNQLKAVTSKPDGFEVLPALNINTLLITGSEDILCTAETNEKMKDFIPDADLIVIEECGHLSPMEQPQKVTEEMRKWLLKDRRISKCKNCSCGKKNNKKGVTNC
ncbi:MULTISPECIES: alpha/beta fold hydrolase [unclassified Sporosarcina]|uniref:alpha/beta fold hydrolase n=1 Tax=unclassified Sporosarcina TaxID=2647733 RepID=UPI00203F21F6|nr:MULTISPECIES: alpha/beta hydrolase [unclassified Sporosarcina]GKV66941.1 alpha/beta hydrolase [Sporosarcina sp. NCCP-2331]GLB57302.1 alpha/beta hydrolase [Sporosarcina sp. NCCP-2378]